LQAAVFLDRDGVINHNRSSYVKTWQEVSFLPGVFPALARLADTPFCVVLVTNQSPIGRGILSSAQVEAIHERMVAEIECHGGRIDGIYYCPHHPDEGCDCRKPRPGLLLRAARDLGLDLGRSYLVGDAVSDVEAALAAGCSPILALTGRGRHQQAMLLERGYSSVAVVADLARAVQLVLRHDASNGKGSPLASNSGP
jgi:D-glycero-D-manno-heptose 1,7-bisphosphate phosphatase